MGRKHKLRHLKKKDGKHSISRPPCSIKPLQAETIFLLFKYYNHFQLFIFFPIYLYKNLIIIYIQKNQNPKLKIPKINQHSGTKNLK